MGVWGEYFAILSSGGVSRQGKQIETAFRACSSSQPSDVPPRLHHRELYDTGACAVQPGPPTLEFCLAAGVKGGVTIWVKLLEVIGLVLGGNANAVFFHHHFNKPAVCDRYVDIATIRVNLLALLTTLRKTCKILSDRQRHFTVPGKAEISFAGVPQEWEVASATLKTDGLTTSVGNLTISRYRSRYIICHQ
jgi:hypothetical protein